MHARKKGKKGWTEHLLTRAGDFFIPKLLWNIFHVYLQIIAPSSCSVRRPVWVVDFARRPFRFQAMGLSHPSLAQLVEGHWKGIQDDVVVKGNILAQVLRTWNQEVFGNIFGNKKRIRAWVCKKLWLIIARINWKSWKFLLSTTRSWSRFQKSRNRWIQEGERKTRLVLSFVNSL